MKPASPANFAAALAATHEYGTIEEVRSSLVRVSGLPEAGLYEVVVFEDDERGYVQTLGEDYVDVLALGAARISLGSRVARTGELLTVPVGEGLRGQAITALGQPLQPEKTFSSYSTEQRLIDITPPHISQRAAITEPLLTGSSIVDLLLPLGLGQREAVFGDQKTGKTSFLFSVLQSFAPQGIVIYVTIGKPVRAIAEALSFISQVSGRENIILVASRSSDVPSLIILTPFTAMTVAEYFRDLGRDVLLILDDMTTHAQFYREVALLGRRFPGRESYPGDIFHLHARLLERGGNFVLPDGRQAAITCLPVAQTVRGDVTGYIPSNLISITDGHLLFDTTLFNQGLRPAIDHTLSVTRVGLKTQPRLARQLNRELTRMLGRYTRAASYAHLGAELNEAVSRLIDGGNKLKVFFSQPPYFPIPLPTQLVMATMIWQGWLVGKADTAAGQWRDRLVQQYTSSPAVRRLLDQLTSVEELAGFVEALTKVREEIIALCTTETVTSEKSA